MESRRVTATILAEKTVHKGWNRLLVATVTTAGGATIERSVEDHGAAAAVLPYDPARRCALLVRQMRVPLLLAYGVQHSLEAPAGILDEDDPVACVRREAMEEAGLRLGPVSHVGSVFPMPGISTERMELFLAEYGAADRIGAGGGLEAENEEIEVVEMPLGELAAMAVKGGLADLKTLALVQALMLGRPELF
jgi:nudix-type nucleoside diphosphatase (YffH/AdpP family)